MKKRTIVCFGPGPIFKGGLSDYNTSLAKTLAAFENTKVHIVSWIQQYPSIIPREFKDKSSKINLLEGTPVTCKYITNYNNPISWAKTAHYIANLNPEIVIFQWSIALQGLPIGNIIKRLKKLCNAEIIVDLHFVVQKEQSKIDRIFTKKGIKNADTYIVHAMKTYHELVAVFPKTVFELTDIGDRKHKPDTKSVLKLFHPVYDLFKPDPQFDVTSFKKAHGLKKHVFLFFGFIRKYKGLHHVIEAFDLVRKQRDDVSLLICGESFWNTLGKQHVSTKIKNTLFGLAKQIFLRKHDDERSYNPLGLIENLNMQRDVVVFNQFIPNEDVHKYFQSSDCVVLYYLTATPSGIESLSYNFKLPILATKVGHFPETIQNGFNGYLAEPNDIHSMADQMLYFLEHPIPAENVEKATEKMSWTNYAKAILNSFN